MPDSGKLQRSPSGPFLEGNDEGDMLFWDAANEEWDARASTEAGDQLYDAVVATDGSGDFLLPSAAFSTLGPAAKVWVRAGTYVETADIVIGSGALLEGAGGVTIDLSGGFELRVNPAGQQTTTGAFSVSTGSATVIGAGSLFTELEVGGQLPANTFLRIKGAFHLIDSITTDTELTLAASYEGDAITAEPVFGQEMVDGFRVENLGFLNADGEAVTITSSRCFQLNSLKVIGSGAAAGDTAAVFVADSAEFSLTEVDVRESDATAVELENCTLAVAQRVYLINNAQDGLKLDDCDRIAVADSFFSQNGDEGVEVLATTATGDVRLVNCGISDNASNGVQSASSVENLTLVSCEIRDNNVGVNPQGVTTLISECSVSSNAQSGITWAGSGSQQLTITNCLVGGNGGMGIDVNGANVMVTGCLVQGNVNDGINTVGDVGIYTGNRVTGNGVNGLEIAASSDDTIVTGNNLRGNTGANLVDLSATTQLANNLS